LKGYKRLIDSKVEAVFLETPPCFFPEHASAAVEAGCHVYMAKPVAIDVPGCLTIAELGNKAGRGKKVFLVDFQTRTDPFYIEAIKQVHEGAIGKIGLITAIYSDEGFPDPPRTATIESRLTRLIWVNDIELGGGKLVNAGVHSIDVALWIAQKKPISAMGLSCINRIEPHSDSPDTYSITYDFDAGPIMNYHGEYVRNTFSTISCHAYGNEGYIETTYGGKVWIRGNQKGYKGGTTEDIYRQGMERNVETFYKSITNGVYDNPTVEPSVNATLACILGEIAGKKNTKVTWDEMIKENKKIETNLSGLQT
jgi:predicted dehydrogenase